MKKWGIIGGVMIVLAVSGLYLKSSGNPESDAPSATSESAPTMAMPVSSLVLKSQEILLEKSLPGRISAFRQSQIRPQVDGIITQRLFEEGAVVEQGQQLYQIDDARYKAALASARADLQSARANIGSVAARVKRYEELVAINAVSKQEYDDAKAQLDQANAAVVVAKAAVDVAQVNLGYTKVYAPIAGQIGRTLITEGALVTANQSEPMAVITQLDPVYVDMQASGGEIMAMRQKMGADDLIPVTLFVGEDNTTPYAHMGTLKFSEVTVERTTGSVALRAVFPNPEGLLLPGLFVRASLEMGEQQVLLVPQRATTRTPDGRLTTWIIDENNQAQSRLFNAADAYKDYWIVKDGLQIGEQIIVEGSQKLSSGLAVTPTAWQESVHDEQEQ